MLGWKFWKVNCLSYDVRIVGIGHRVKDNDLKYVLPTIDNENEPNDLIGYGNSKRNPAKLYCGKAGTGKSTLMAWNIWQITDPAECETFSRIPERAVIFSPKTFGSLDDFDYALPTFERIDMTKKLPSNIFANHHAFVGSLLTAVYSNLTMRGMMVKNVETQLYKLLKKGNIQTWEDFERVLNNAKKNGGEFDKTVLESIEGDIQFLKDAGTEGTLDIDWSDLKKNYVLDFGTFGENRTAKIFFMEYYLRIVFNHRLQNILAIDEVHRLLNRSETSILSEVLREGRTSIKLHLATQNFSDVPPSNMHFGSIFAHETQNGDDFKACGDEFVKDYWKLLRGHRFIDLTHEHQNQTIPIYQLDPTRLNEVRVETRLLWSEDEENDTRIQQEKKNIVTEKDRKTENLDEKVVDVLKTSDVAMYGYEIARKIGLSPKNAVQIRQPLRSLVGNKISEWECQVRKKEIVYYYLPDTEQCHNIMTRESRKHFGDWKVIFEASHGTGKSDFIIEKDGRKIAIECETFLKKDIADLQDRVAKNHLEGIETIIVVPTDEAKAWYQASFDCKVILIPELAEALGTDSKTT